MSSSALSDPLGADSHDSSSSVNSGIPIIVEPEAEERGRLKRRRQSSASPRRASSPSRGHDRNSGSRYRAHHRKHHRPSSPSSSISPPTTIQKKTRRRSDAEPDHTFRGRARNRSGSRNRARSLILEDDDDAAEEFIRTFRKRSQPPSRHRIDEDDADNDLRRQRSYQNLYQLGRRDSKGVEGHDTGGKERAHVQRDRVALASQVA